MLGWDCSSGTARLTRRVTKREEENPATSLRRRQPATRGPRLYRRRAGKPDTRFRSGCSHSCRTRVVTLGQSHQFQEKGHGWLARGSSVTLRTEMRGSHTLRQQPASTPRLTIAQVDGHGESCDAVLSNFGEGGLVLDCPRYFRPNAIVRIEGKLNTDSHPVQLVSRAGSSPAVRSTDFRIGSASSFWTRITARRRSDDCWSGMAISDATRGGL
jgi:hypothetical protein